MFQAAAAAPLQPAMPTLDLPRMFALECLDISSELKMSDLEKVFGRDGVNLKEKLLDPLLAGFTTRQTLSQALLNAATTRYTRRRLSWYAISCHILNFLAFCVCSAAPPQPPVPAAPAFFAAPQAPPPPAPPPQNLSHTLFDCGKLFVVQATGRCFAPLSHADLRLAGRSDLIDVVFEVTFPIFQLRPL